MNTKPDAVRAATARLILEASTGLHGHVAKQLADAWTEMVTALAEQPASVAEGTIVLPSGHRVVIADAREDIAHVLQYWLDHNKRQADKDGRAVTRATHVAPTEWPDRGTLENWIAVLRAQGPALAAAPKPEDTK